MDKATTGGQGRVRQGIRGLNEDLARQATAVGTRSPVQARLAAVLRPLLEGWVGARLASAWEARAFPIFYERPLLILDSLRFEATAEGPSHPLYAALRDEDPVPDALDEASLLAALAPERPVWRSLATRFVQTNETTRAVIWRWPLTLIPPRPVVLIDVGASAGLNLVADALPSPWTDAAGQPLSVAAAPDVRLRLGLDAHPLDASDDDTARWLIACVWPGETERLARLRAAIAAARRTPPTLETLLVRDAPGRIARAVDDHPGAIVLAYQSIVRDYLAEEERRAYEVGLAALVAARGPARLLWLELEIGGEGFSPTLPCEIRAHAKDQTFVLARSGYHPQAVAVNADEVARFVAAVAAAG